MPAKRLPQVGLGLKPHAATLSAAAVALVASEAVRRLRRLLATTGGPIIILLANGSLLRAERLLFPAGPDRRLRYSAIGTAPGDGPEDFESGSVSLAPSGSVFALRIIDALVDGVDSIVAIRSTIGHETLFYGTDNTLAPTTTWSGDDPAAPAWLLAEQASRDAEWQALLEDDPTIPRPIVEGWFADVSTDGEAWPAGWTAAGELRLSGMTRPSFRLQDETWWGDDLEPWWALIGPTAAGAWGFVARDHGTIPATWPAVPPLSPVLDVSVNAAGQLLVDGVAQVSPLLDAEVISVSGPFA